MEIGLRRQLTGDRVDALGRHSGPATLGSPELDRYAYVPEAVLGKKDSERIGNDGGSDTRIVRQFRKRPLMNLLADRAIRAVTHFETLPESRAGSGNDEPRVPAP